MAKIMKNATQGGGFCEWDEENKRYFFTENPPEGFEIGDFVPEEWGIQDVEIEEKNSDSEPKILFVKKTKKSASKKGFTHPNKNLSKGEINSLKHKSFKSEEEMELLRKYCPNWGR